MWKGAFVCLLQGQGKPSNEVALQVYERLAETRGVVTRFRGKEMGYCGCLCGTIGTEHDVSRFLLELKVVRRNNQDGPYTRENPNDRADLESNVEDEVRTNLHTEHVTKSNIAARVPSRNYPDALASVRR
ncbi:hypothetical protein Q7P37_011224 [Cladosporium fusiforme]